MHKELIKVFGFPLVYRIQTLQPKSSVRSPAKSSTTTKGHFKEMSNVEENKLSAPYIRRLSRKEKEKWGNDEEATALCHSNMHEVSIVASNKDVSTAV